MTIEEYYALPEGTRAELIYGVIYDMSPPLRIHQKIITKVLTRFENFIQSKKGDCEVYTLPFDVRLSDDTAVEPDIAVVCDKSKLTDKGCEGAPDFIIEIASSNSAHDYVRKLNLYYDYGVREYWIVDPKRKSVNVHLLDENYGTNYYTFSDDVPVNIYGGELKINISELLGQGSSC